MLRLLLLAFALAGLPRSALADGVPDSAKPCAACHGAAGVPVSPGTPVIWGQNEGYLYLQLRDMQRGTRAVPAMAPFVKGLDKPAMQALAAYFASLPWPDLRQPAAAEAAASRAQLANTSIGCTGCHLDGYLAAGSVPRLAGQERAYVARTMGDFRTGARGNNPGMTDLMNAADAADFPAIAAYLAGL